MSKQTYSRVAKRIQSHIGQPGGAVTIISSGDGGGASGDYLPLDGTGTMAGNLDMGGNNIDDVNTINGFDFDDIGNASHARQHNITSTDDHTITSAKWGLVGATATNTIGILTPSAAPGAAEAILKSTSSGGLTLPTFTATTSVTTPVVTSDGDITLDPAFVGNKVYIGGLLTGGFGARHSSGTEDWNDSSNARSGQGYSLLNGDDTNGPSDAGGAYFHPFGFEYTQKDGTGDLTQLAIPYGNNTSINAGIWMRGRTSSVWGEWVRVISENTNGSVGINTISPSSAYKLDVSGDARATGTVYANTALQTPLINTATGDLTLSPADDIMLDPTSNLVKATSGVSLQADNYASQVSGWRVTYDGQADFRYIYTDELHAKAFIADLEQALAGGQIIAKSVTILYSDFTAPAAGGTASLTVRDLPSATGMAVFVDGDYIRIREFSRSGGSLSIADCWGTVVLDTSYGTSGFDSATKTQRYTFTRSASPNAGAMTVGNVVEADAIILDYGTSGNGFYEVNAIDGLYGANSPYSQIVTWSGHPRNQTVQARLGNLYGIWSVTGEYGLYAGEGVTDDDSYLRISNNAVRLNNVPLQLYDSGTQTVNIDSTGTNIWVGPSSADRRLSWNGTTLTVTGQIIIQNPEDIDTSSLTNDAGWTAGATWGSNIVNQPSTLGDINSTEGTKLSGIAAGATVGATWGTNLGNIPDRFGEAPSDPGLYLTGTHLGYYNGSEWKAWMAATGEFYFGGSSGAHLQWSGRYLRGIGSGSTVQWFADSEDGVFYFGGGSGWLDSSGLAIETGSSSASALANVNKVRWVADAESDPHFWIGATKTLATTEAVLWAEDPDGDTTQLTALAIAGATNNALVTLQASVGANSSQWIFSRLSSGSVFASFPGEIRVNDVKPQSNNGGDLGTASLYYDHAYISNLHVATIVGTPDYSHSHSAGDITSGTLDLDLIPATLTGKSADFLDGLNSSDFALAGHSHAYLPLAGGQLTGNITFIGAQTVDGVDISAFYTAYGNHNHDTRYYTQTAVNSLLTGYVPTSRTVTGTGGLQGGGALTGNISLSHANTSNEDSVSGSGTTFVQGVTIDDFGHVTGLATGDVGTALDSRFVNVTGDTMTGALTVPEILNAVVSQPSQSSQNMSMIGYFDRNELAYANFSGTVTYNITGAYGVISDGDTIVGGSGDFAQIRDTDVTTTQIIITVDRGSTVNAYAHGYWQPFLAYRTDTGEEYTWYNNVVVEVSSDGSTWYKPSSGAWETSDFNDEKQSDGLWIAGYDRPQVPGTVWRYARFILTDRREDSGYSLKDRVWIAAVGVRHVSAKFSHIWLDRAGDTMFGDFVIQTGGVNIFDVDVSAALTTVSGDLDVTDDATIDGTLTVSPNSDVITELGNAKIGWADGTGSATFSHYNRHSSDAFALAQYSDGSTMLNAANGQYIDLGVNGLATATINAERINPRSTVAIDLGDYNRKYRSLFAAELYVETLVAQDVLATIGGRVMVAPTTKLTADVVSSDTTIDIEHNNLASGDYIYLSSARGGTPQIEAMKVTSGPTSLFDGDYRYSVTRNLDGTGANDWDAGDAVVSLGGAVGEGYIDLTSTSTIHNHFGPTMTVYSRTATTNWDDVNAVVSVGNLRSFVDYASDEFGLALGNDLTLTPTTGFSGITADASDGLRLFNTDIALYNGGTQTVNIDNTGTDVWFGTSSANKLFVWNGSSIALRSNGTDTINLSASGNASIAGVVNIGASGGIYQGSGTFASPTTGLKIWNNGGDGRISLFNSEDAVSWYDGDSGLVFEANSNFTSFDNWRSVSFEENGDTIGFLTGFYQPEGSSDGLLLQSEGPSAGGEKRDIWIRALNTGSDSDIYIQAIASSNSAAISLNGANAGSSITLDADNTIVNGDLDLNGNDITDIGTLGETWISPTFNTGWSNYGSNYTLAGYKRVGDIVFVHGMVKRTSGTATTIFTLPVGYRPQDNVIRPASTNGGTYAELRVLDTGEVVMQTGSATWFAFNAWFSTLA